MAVNSVRVVADTFTGLFKGRAVAALENPDLNMQGLSSEGFSAASLFDRVKKELFSLVSVFTGNTGEKTSRSLDFATNPYGAIKENIERIESEQSRIRNERSEDGAMSAQLEYLEDEVVKTGVLAPYC